MIKKILRRIKYGTTARIDMFRMHRQWRAIQARAYSPRKITSVRKLLIIPSDPWTLVGAKGDEAMMEAAVGPLRAREPGLVVGVVVATQVASDAARGLGFVPIPAWSGSLTDSIAQIEQFQPDGMVILGADIMDGYYGPSGPMRVLMIADTAARMGVRVSILGFSFNQHPSPRLKPVFDALHRDVAVNVRDRISYERYARFTSTPAALVADAAFMLAPTPDTPALAEVRDWCARRRAAGDILLGFNVHPMLIKEVSAEQIKALADNALQALRDVAGKHPVSVMLISHDYRVIGGDDPCLAPIIDGLRAELGDRIAYPTDKFSAAELKAIAGMMDGVVTGRMHLAIATLGMGKPVVGLTYQDKFQGLFAHFHYPERFLMPPADVMTPGKLAALVNDFVGSLPQLQKVVDEHLPQVKAASARNLEGLTGTRRPETAPQANAGALVQNPV